MSVPGMCVCVCVHLVRVYSSSRIFQISNSRIGRVNHYYGAQHCLKAACPIWLCMNGRFCRDVKMKKHFIQSRHLFRWWLWCCSGRTRVFEAKRCWCWYGGDVSSTRHWHFFTLLNRFWLKSMLSQRRKNKQQKCAHHTLVYIIL